MLRQSVTTSQSHRPAPKAQPKEEPPSSPPPTQQISAPKELTYKSRLMGLGAGRWALELYGGKSIGIWSALQRNHTDEAFCISQCVCWMGWRHKLDKRLPLSLSLAHLCRSMLLLLLRTVCKEREWQENVSKSVSDPQVAHCGSGLHPYFSWMERPAR